MTVASITTSAEAERKATEGKSARKNARIKKSYTNYLSTDYSEDQFEDGLLVIAPMATRKVVRILRPRSTTNTGTVVTPSVEGLEEVSVDTDAGIREPERLAAVALSVFGAGKRDTSRGIVLSQHHLRDFKQDQWNASSVVGLIS